MHIRGRGVAYRFWLAVEQNRVALGWSKSDLANRTGVARSTINNLARSKRPPQPRIVQALAEAVGIDWTDAAGLAQLVPTEQATLTSDDVRSAILRSTAYTEAQRVALLSMMDAMEEANRPSVPPGTRGGHNGTNVGHVG